MSYRKPAEPEAPDEAPPSERRPPRHDAPPPPADDASLDDGAGAGLWGELRSLARWLSPWARLDR